MSSSYTCIPTLYFFLVLDLFSTIRARRTYYADNYSQGKYEDAVTVYSTDCRYLEAGMDDVKGREGESIR